MKDPKTTIPGILAIVISVATYASQFITAHTWPPSIATIGLFLVGLIGLFAKDAA